MTASIKNAGREGENGISEMLHGASERIAELKDESVKTLGKRVGALGSAMKKHPLLAIGIGLGAGYLLARLIHRG